MRQSFRAAIRLPAHLLNLWQHLPGSEKGWVDEQHAAPGSRLLDGNARHQDWWRVHLHETPWMLDSKARQIVLERLCSVCAHRQWICHAVHIRTTHVHAVVTGETAPERMLSDFRLMPHERSAMRRPRFSGTDTGLIMEVQLLWNEVSFRAALTT